MNCKAKFTDEELCLCENFNNLYSKKRGQNTLN